MSIEMIYNLSRAILMIAAMLLAPVVFASDVSVPGMSIDFNSGSESNEVATAFKILLLLTLLSLAPAIVIMMTSFTRIIIVLSMLRQAFGMQQTPPNTVLVGLTLFLTLFNMMPVFETINSEAFQPLLKNEVSSEQAFTSGMAPLRNFMIRQTNESDLKLIVELAGAKVPDEVDDIASIHIIPAFMLSELKTAFQIGFVIFLPFLLVDLVIASILMSMGMIMVPPMMISLPVKILMFVLIDGWALVVQALLSSFK